MAKEWKRKVSFCIAFKLVLYETARQVETQKGERHPENRIFDLIKESYSACK